MWTSAVSHFHPLFSLIPFYECPGAKTLAGGKIVGQQQLHRIDNHFPARIGHAGQTRGKTETVLIVISINNFYAFRQSEIRLK